MTESESHMHDRPPRLFEMVTPLHELTETVDWTAVEADYGLVFPADYKAFVDRFGAGTLGEDVFVSVPRVGRPAAALTVDRLPEDTLREEGMANWQDASLPDRPDLRDMLVWGESSGADALCWMTAGPDPDAWPVAVWSRHHGGWARYPYGMTEFLTNILTDGFADGFADGSAEFPLSDESLRGAGSTPYVNLEAENRLRDAGIDPWTGRPIPQMWDEG
ncbi:SMI1/KNR4 family protein [Streptomyces sp. NPDC090025]|uniref:SMI1/KNR4 family protein n=1 Tax=Streptomyces sp. NPDC090025 TaxID=3365922 RepID=UPI003838E121